jgi:hypothetical protein
MGRKVTVAEPAPDTPTIDQARAIAAAGLRVLPIKPGRKNPPMKSWQTAASVEEKAIAAWWNGLYRGYGIGIAMGPQPDGRNVFAIDIDTHDDDANGYDTIAELEAVHGDLPATVTSNTGSGGMHQVYRAPAGVVVRNQQADGKRIGPGVDVRGDGGQIVVAPTIHPDTHRIYHWAAGRAPWEIAIADAPDWLLEMVAERPAAPAPPRTLEPFTSPRASGESAADILRSQWHWPTELAATGWQEHHTDGDDTYYTRPGKDTRHGHSAVLHGTDGPFVVFTTDISSDLRQLGHPTRDGSGYAFSPLEWDAAHRHNGSLSDASRAVIAANRPQVAAHAPHGADVAEDVPVDYDGALNAMLVDWATFWDIDHNEADWLAEPVIAAKRSTAIFAPGGTGKSLLALFIAACIATGRTLFGRPLEPTSVLYLDYEMTADDLAERLTSMGFDDEDLSRLHYALLPSLPGLDEPEGGKAVVRLAEMCDADLVVIDTFGRAVHGDENDADTVRSWYRWTGIHLKHAGRAFVRVDHAGKDVAKGQRGTSAKNDDVDVVWQMTAKEGGAFTLTAKKRRMGWVPMTVDLVMHEDGRLHFELLSGHTWPAGTAEMAATLDDLGVPDGVTKRAARVALKDAGKGAKDTVLGAAIKYRKERSNTYRFAGDLTVDNPVDAAGTTPGTTHADEGGNHAGNHSPPKTPKPLVDAPGNHSGNHGEPLADADGNHPASRKGAVVPSVPDDPDPTPPTDDQFPPF